MSAQRWEKLRVDPDDADMYIALSRFTLPFAEGTPSVAVDASSSYLDVPMWRRAKVVYRFVVSIPDKMFVD